LVADPLSIFKDSYWQTSPAFNAYGNQFNANKDGDLPQDVYRFMGGFVLRDKEKDTAEYGIYSSMVVGTGCRGVC
jgi:hypothetical protein